MANSLRLTSWNGIQLNLPSTWEVVVTGPCHLAVEADFLPVFEVRWEQFANPQAGISLKKAIAKIQKHFPGEMSQLQPPETFKQYTKHFQAIALSWDGGSKVSGLLHRCDTCGTIVLVHLYDHPTLTSTQILDALMNLRCHSNTTDNGMQLWSIQDFQFEVPKEFQFQHQVFKAGFSSISFSHKKLSARFCRLAPADKRLVEQSIEQLLATMLDITLPDNGYSLDQHTYCCWNNPTLLYQIRCRLRRKKPFYWGMVRYLPSVNRIVVLAVEATHPLPQEELQSLFDRYEIIP